MHVRTTVPVFKPEGTNGTRTDPGRTLGHGGYRPVSVDGADYLLIVDYYSRFIEFCRLPNTSSSMVIIHTKSNFARHGIPKSVRSDNGPQFSAMEYSKFAEEWSFAHITSNPYHPQSNGLAEKSVQIIK